MGEPKKILEAAVPGPPVLPPQPYVTQTHIPPPIDSYEAPNNGLGPEGEAFLESLRQARDLGADFQTSRSVTIVGDPAVTWFCHPDRWCIASIDNGLRTALSHALIGGDIDFIANDLGNFSKALGKFTPDFIVAHETDVMVEQGRMLTETGRTIEFPAVTMHVDIKDGFYRVVIWNWFEDEPFFVKSYPAGPRERDPFWHVVGDELHDAISGHLNAFDFNVAIDRLPPLTAEEQKALDAQAVYHVNHPAGWSDADIAVSGRSWEELTDTFKVTLHGRSFGAEIDRDATMPIIYRPIELEITPCRLKQMNELALEIRGFVDSIDLDVPSEDAQFEMGLDPRLKWESSEGFRDKRGNLIAPLYGMLKLSGRPTFLGFRIYPAYRLSREPSSSSIETIGVDLSRFGFGDHGRLMTVRSLPPTRVPDTSNPYFLYSTLPPEAVPGAEGVFEQAGILAAKAEDAFGFEPGNRLDSIFLVPSKRWNASVRFANPRSFFIWDEMFEDLLSGSAGDIVFHEVCHSLDFQFSFSTHKTLLGIFDALSKAEDTDLFRAINESAFFETKGGHSGDNVFEFFATLTNSIRSPKWREKVLAMDKRVRALYYHSLKALAEALATKHAPLVSSPIYKLVGERIPELEGMSERPGDKAPYPDFSDVIQEPVSSIISKGPDPLRVIMAQDFEREVLGASEPVILVMFYDNVHTSIDHLRSIWEQYRSRGKVVFMPMREAEFTAEHTDKQTSTGRPFIFWRGKLASKPKFGELKEEETQQRVETALVEIERLHPTPIPIIGPLIDLFRQ